MINLRHFSEVRTLNGRSCLTLLTLSQVSEIFKQINVYDGVDVSCGVVQSETRRIEFQSQIVKTALRLLPCYSSPFGGGQIAKPKSKSATNDMPIVSRMDRAKLVKNPLTNAATVVSLKISNTACDNTFLLSLWNNAMVEAYHILENLSSNAYANIALDTFDIVTSVRDRWSSSRQAA